MRKTFFLATIVGLGSAVPFAGAGAADTRSECLRELHETEARYSTVRERLDTGQRRGLATLQSAAGYLSSVNQDEACEEVVEAIGNLLAEREKELVDQGELMPRDKRVRMDRLQQAATSTGSVGALRARDLIGTEVRNLQDEELGEIDDVIVNPADGKALFALISTGGVLGIGEDYVAVPVTMLGFTEEMDMAVLDIPEDKFEAAPQIEQSRIENAGDTEWRQESQHYFEENVQKP